MRRRTIVAVTMLALVALSGPSELHSYGGPGSVVTGIGTLLAVIAAIGAAIVGFLWFPLKRLYHKFLGSGGDDRDIQRTSDAS